MRTLSRADGSEQSGDSVLNDFVFPVEQFGPSTAGDKIIQDKISFPEAVPPAPGCLGLAKFKSLWLELVWSFEIWALKFLRRP